MIKMESVISKKRLELPLERNYIFVLLVGFFLSRVSVLDNLTPFGVAFLASYVIMKRENKGLLILVLLGTLSAQGLGGISYLLTSICIFGFFAIYRENKRHTLLVASSIAAGIYIFIKVLTTLLMKELFIYDLFLTGFEGILIFTMTYIFSFSQPIESMGKSGLGYESIICVFITLALVLSGFNNWVIFDISLKNIISLTVIIYLSYSQGILTGVASGTIIGMVSYISHTEMPFIISILTVGALLSGLFRDLGKIGSILGFILGNAIISFYINGLGSSFIDYREIFIASLGFFVFQHYFHKDIENLISENRAVKRDYEEQRMEMVKKKLNNMEELFDSLSKVFKDSIENKDIYSDVEIYSLVDEISNKSCSKCKNYNECWGETYYTAYYKVFTLLSLLESEISDRDKYVETLEGFCNNEEKLITSVQLAYEKFKSDYCWNLMLRDQRMLLAEQLRGVGQAIKTINKDIYSNPIFNEELEELLIKELKDKRLDVKSLKVAELEKDDFEILVQLDFTEDLSDDMEKVKSIVSKNLGYPLASDYTYSNINKDKRKFKLVRTNRYSSLTKVTRASNSENKVSGDNYTFGEKNNINFLAISDGMGIGKKANIESSTAIELFEKLMEVNLDKETSIKTINSVLRTKSNDEIFTTMDMGFIDLYTGKLQVLKTGAPATFIKRKDEVLIINSQSLPIGILKDIDFNVYEENLQDGDIIIMMSDGVLDSKKDIKNSEEWMKNLIRNLDYQNPEAIAQEILNTAQFVSKGRPKDDMTVMATKIWKSI